MDFDIMSLIGQLALAGLCLGIAALAYSAWFVSGIANAAIKTKTWSWKRGATDLGKCLAVVYVVFAVVVIVNLATFAAAMIDFDISGFTSVLSTTVICGTLIGGALGLAVKAISNVWNLIKFKPVDKTQVAGDSDVDYQAIGNAVVDTITKLAAKDDIEQDEAADDSVREYTDITDKELADAEAGKGGITNTYPEPYRSAGQDTLVDPSSCYNRECVSYCAWKIKELTGKWLVRTGGMNAKYWVERLRENGYGVLVAAPKNGGKYIGVSTLGQYGHVIWFEEGTTISEYNYMSRGGFSIRTVNLSAYTWVQIKAPSSEGGYIAGVKRDDQEIADEVIAGKWGTKDTNPTREQQLTAAGYNFNTIQAIVNAKLAPKTTPKNTKESKNFSVGDYVRPLNPVDYTGRALRQYDNRYTITGLNGNRAVLSARGAVWAAVNTANLEKV